MRLTIFKSSLVKHLSVTLLALAPFSISAFAGGDSYEIYLNKKLIAPRQHVHNAKGVIHLKLDQANVNDVLTITYSHCGQVGKGRSIAILDNQNRVIKEWKFDDNGEMSIPVKEILTIQKKNSENGLKLYYSSKQYLPKGRMLASINGSEKSVTQASDNSDEYWPALAGVFFALTAAGWMYWRSA
jgi:hypothetical protein